MLSAAQQQRIRARLLEFLKFRVLAAQEVFFESWQQDDGHDCERFRDWLRGICPEALKLSDADLVSVLQQARTLYVN